MYTYVLNVQRRSLNVCKFKYQQMFQFTDIFGRPKLITKYLQPYYSFQAFTLMCLFMGLTVCLYSIPVSLKPIAESKIGIGRIKVWIHDSYTSLTFLKHVRFTNYYAKLIGELDIGKMKAWIHD